MERRLQLQFLRELHFIEALDIPERPDTAT